jgi:hypothetical protein
LVKSNGVRCPPLTAYNATGIEIYECAATVNSEAFDRAAALAMLAKCK